MPPGYNSDRFTRDLSTFVPGMRTDQGRDMRYRPDQGETERWLGRMFCSAVLIGNTPNACTRLLSLLSDERFIFIAELRGTRWWVQLSTLQRKQVHLSPSA